MQGKNYEVLSTAGLQLKMSKWRDYKVTLNGGSQFSVAIFGNQEEFKSFCSQCKNCSKSCDQERFLSCVNEKKRTEIMAFANRKEAREFFQLMLFL